jgi:hypothetical protein
LCQLPSGARQVSCPASLPRGHSGGLSVVSGRVVFVDTTADTFQVVESDGLGEARGYPKLVTSSPASYDLQTQQRLWAVSEDLTDVRFPLDV